MIHVSYLRKYGMEKSYVEKEHNLRLNGTRDRGQRRKRGVLEKLWLALHPTAKGKPSQAFQLRAKAHKRTVNLLRTEQITGHSNYQLKNL